VLDQQFSGWEQLAIHESSPSHDYVGRFCERYSYSHYLRGVTNGQVVDGVRCEDIEHLTFPDNHFDLFVTQDVLEHVFDPGQGIKEIMRVIKSGGAHVFTTPKHRGLPVSRQRAKLVDGQILHLEDAQYHGSPVGDGRALVTWDFGDDFESLVGNWCGYPTATCVARDRRLGIDGEYLEVFVTHKA
jgi:SAM-dependent methyltransferase